VFIYYNLSQGLSHLEMTLYYQSHLYPTETFIEAMKQLYEDDFIVRAVLICLNDDDVLKYTDELNKHLYSAIAVKTTNTSVSLSSSLLQFKEQPNQILVMPIKVFQEFDKATFEQQLMRIQWNTLVSVDVPTYMMDSLLERIIDAHKRGFWENYMNTIPEFHLMWYQH